MYGNFMIKLLENSDLNYPQLIYITSERTNTDESKDFQFA